MKRGNNKSPSRKNDNCYVEQKNWSAIKRVAEYLRYGTEEPLKILNELYGYYRLKDLKDICKGLNLAELMRQIEKLQDKLIILASKKLKRFEYTLCEGYDK